MNEELIPLQDFHGARFDPTAELVRGSCAGIEGRIQNASSRDEAVRIMDDACRTLLSACESKMVKEAAMRHVKAIMAKYWSLHD